MSCNDAFNFSEEKSHEERTRAFVALMDCPFGPFPLVEDEKERLKAEL